jgi:hypothetical protein
MQWPDPYAAAPSDARTARHVTARQQPAPGDEGDRSPTFIPALLVLLFLGG